MAFADVENGSESIDSLPPVICLLCSAREEVALEIAEPANDPDRPLEPRNEGTPPPTAREFGEPATPPFPFPPWWGVIVEDP